MKKQLKIGILGSRGIPNAYGGFEQFAESLALFLVKNGHEVSVYNSSLHPNQEKNWNGINIISRKDPEDKIGTAGQFIYDLNCILHSRKAGFDVLLQLGYTSSAIWSFLLPKKSVILTNMDGLEWKRSKYSRPIQKFLRWSEKVAANSSDYLVADSIGIRDHLETNLNKNSTYIPYGAKVFKDPKPDCLKKYKLEKNGYHMLIARMEPENNIETILSGYSLSKSKLPFVVIGNVKTEYGAYIRNKFSSPKVPFLGAIYDQAELNNLRFYSDTYFHGHSVGGTNPSLLEAMASSSFICAHDNIFNRSILENDAVYFKNDSEIAQIINESGIDKNVMISNNLKKITEKYNEQLINSRYEDLILRICN